MSILSKKETGLTIYDIAAEEGIVKILDLELVAFRNEFHYRLENASTYQLGVPTVEHQVTDAAIKRLEASGKIEPTRPPGRRPNTYVAGQYAHIFYKKGEMEYGRLPEIMKEKIDLSRFIMGLSSYAGFYAQNLWLEAFRAKSFDFLEENVSEFEGNSAGVEGDIDFIVRKDGILFGVEVKNGFSYAYDIKNKFRIAVELKTVPFFVVRGLPFRIREWITDNGGLVLPYGSSIYPPECKTKIDKCVDRLGYPLIILVRINEDFGNRLVNIARLAYARRKEMGVKRRRYLEALAIVT